MSVQPVIEESAECVAQEDGGRNDETDLGVTSCGDQGVRFRRTIWIFGHDKGDSTLRARGGFRAAPEGETDKAGSWQA